MEHVPLQYVKLVEADTYAGEMKEEPHKHLTKFLQLVATVNLYYITCNVVDSALLFR